MENERIFVVLKVNKLMCFLQHYAICYNPCSVEIIFVSNFSSLDTPWLKKKTKRNNKIIHPFVNHSTSKDETFIKIARFIHMGMTNDPEHLYIN